VRTVRDLAEVRPGSPAYVSIGVFDGVHLGHQHLITEMVRAAHSAGDLAIAYTFDPHPLTALGREAPPLLTTVEERAEIMAALGLDVLVVPPFTPATARMRAADFAAALVRYLRLVELWAGPDFALGYRREGDVRFLQRLGVRLGFTVRVVEPLVCEGAHVSSSRVRAALRAGEVLWARRCLGRPYRLTGVVVRTDGGGAAVELPAAAISPLPGRLVPAAGVYACLVHVERSGAYPALTTVVAHSAVQGHFEQLLAVEAHLLDFEGDLCGQTLALDFIARLREERAPLTHHDIDRARAVLSAETQGEGSWSDLTLRSPQQ